MHFLFKYLYGSYLNISHDSDISQPDYGDGAANAYNGNTVHRGQRDRDPIFGNKYGSWHRSFANSGSHRSSGDDS